MPGSDAAVLLRRTGAAGYNLGPDAYLQVALLYGHVRADLAVTGGVHDSAHVLKSMMAGAGVAIIDVRPPCRTASRTLGVRADLMQWMEQHEYASIGQMQGA